MPDAKLTRAQAGRLGGLQAAHNLGPEGVRRRGAKGGLTTVERFGRAHRARLAHRRHGRLTETANAAGISGGVRGLANPATGQEMTR